MTEATTVTARSNRDGIGEQGEVGKVRHDAVIFRVRLGRLPTERLLGFLIDFAGVVIST